MDWWQTAFDDIYRKEYATQDARTKDEIVAFVLSVIPKGKVLDVGCGYGRIAHPLAEVGYEMFGVDYSSSQVKLAKKGTGEYRKGDMRTLPYPDANFDSVISMFTSFGYFEDRADDKKTLEEAYRVLKRNGTFILDYTTRQNTADEFFRIKRGKFEGKFRQYSKKEMQDLLKKSKFIVKAIYGNYNKDEFSSQSQRMIFVCTK